jgi:hypothetical protein
LPDAFLDWNADFVVSATGGLLLVDGIPLSNQRIIRRLSTAVQGDVFHLEYGAGLLQRIGKPGVTSQIASIVRAQIALEATVAATPPPVVTVTEVANNPGAFIILIQYTFAATGEPVTLSFTTTTT